MTPDRLRACLEALAWSQRGLAALLGLDDRQVRRWASGEYAVPDPVAVWLDRLARFHEENPPPRWRQTQKDGPNGLQRGN